MTATDVTATSTLPLPPAVFELTLLGGGDICGYLAAIHAAADSGLQHLVLTGPRPHWHPATAALRGCGIECGMHVSFTATAPTSPIEHAPRMRLAADGIPRLVIPDGIPLTELPALLGPDLAAFTDPQELHALETAYRTRAASRTACPSAPW